MHLPSFYLGRWSGSGQTPAGEPTLYDPADLTTHAVVVGMTGSGKTGLLISLLEEAARQGTPAVIIDPKGDLTNLLLHFPELRPADFEPWIDPEAARRQNLSPAELAGKTAARWQEGLAEWNLGQEQIAELAEKVDYTIYTPGSTAGVPVNLLSSFEAPRIGWDEHREVLRERISSTVTALLGLVGVGDIDPLRSREHILLANLLENAWSQGQSLDLTELILQVQNPPIERLGAFPLDRFFPEKDRFELALLLNNFLAAPSFQTWLEGQPLDLPAMLHSPQGKPRFSIFYLAHLSETERMFFVTLLLAAVETWMRAQRGTSGLRALLAFDEIVGYLPPVANPPSRPVLLRLLKQARAFGLGIVLATQNPSDLNYKALSNAGTWFIGRLQTEQDKNRLLDGLQSLETGIDRAAFDRMIAALRPRLFLLHNVHQSGPQVFHTRWTLNYLAGPLTRAQIPPLRDRFAQPPAVTPAPQPAAHIYESTAAAAPQRVEPVSAPKPGTLPTSPLAAPTPAPAHPQPARVQTPAPAARRAEHFAATRPPIPDGVSEFFHPQMISLNKALSAVGVAFAGPLEPLGVVFRAGIAAQAEVHYLSRRYNLNFTRRAAALIPAPPRGGPAARAEWDVFAHEPFDPRLLSPQPLTEGRYAPLPAEWAAPRALNALQKDFVDWVYRTGKASIRANEVFKVYAPPDMPDHEFRRQLDDALRAGLESELAKIAAGFDQKLETLKRRIERQKDMVDRREDEVDHRRAEQSGADFELITSLFTRRKRSLSSSLTKRRLTHQARAGLDEARQNLENLKQEWNKLLDQRQFEIQRVTAEWQERAAQVTEIPLTPYKKDIFVQTFGLIWLPYYQVQGRDGVFEAPAF